MRMRIRRFGVVRTASVMTIANTLVFAAIFLPIAVIALIVLVAVDQPGTAAAGVGILVFAIVGIVSGAIFGWLFTALHLAFVNLAARWVGGIEVDVEPEPTAGYPPGYPPPGYPPPGYTPPGYPPTYGPGASAGPSYRPPPPETLADNP